MCVNRAITVDGNGNALSLSSSSWPCMRPYTTFIRFSMKSDTVLLCRTWRTFVAAAAAAERTDNRPEAAVNSANRRIVNNGEDATRRQLAISFGRDLIKIRINRTTRTRPRRADVPCSSVALCIGTNEGVFVLKYGRLRRRFSAPVGASQRRSQRSTVSAL